MKTSYKAPARIFAFVAAPLAGLLSIGCVHTQTAQHTVPAAGTRPEGFVVINNNDYSGHAARAAGRPVRADRMEAPYAAMRRDFPDLMPGDWLFIPGSGLLYPGADKCKAPDVQKVVERLHRMRPPSFSGYVFPDMEGGCWEYIRGGHGVPPAQRDPRLVAEYDPIFAAWFRAVRTAFPNAKIAGYFMPSNSHVRHLARWQDNGEPDPVWLAIAQAQRQTLAEIDILMPELYFGWREDRLERYPEQKNKLTMAMRWIVENYPNHKVMPITWLSWFYGAPSPAAPLNPPCQPPRPHLTWDGKTGEAPRCGYYGMPYDMGVDWLMALYDTGVHGIYKWNTATDYGMWQDGHPEMEGFASVRAFLKRISR